MTISNLLNVLTIVIAVLILPIGYLAKKRRIADIKSILDELKVAYDRRSRRDNYELGSSTSAEMVAKEMGAAFDDSRTALLLQHNFAEMAARIVNQSFADYYSFLDLSIASPVGEVKLLSDKKFESFDDSFRELLAPDFQSSKKLVAQLFAPRIKPQKSYYQFSSMSFPDQDDSLDGLQTFKRAASIH